MRVCVCVCVRRETNIEEGIRERERQTVCRGGIYLCLREYVYVCIYICNVCVCMYVVYVSYCGVYGRSDHTNIYTSIVITLSLSFLYIHTYTPSILSGSHTYKRIQSLSLSISVIHTYIYTHSYLLFNIHRLLLLVHRWRSYGCVAYFHLYVCMCVYVYMYVLVRVLVCVYICVCNI